MRKFSQFWLFCFLVLPLLFTTKSTIAQNLGFEATASTPPNNWTAVTGIWNTITTNVRTGNQSMTVTGAASSGTTITTTNPFVTAAAAGNYLITMGWGKSNSASNSLFYLGYRSGTTNTFNPTSTSSGQAANVNNTSWSRVVSVSAATVAAGSYGVCLRGFTSATNATTELYIDDIIMYSSASNVPDISAPNAATAASFTGATLNWTNGTDNGTPASGIGGVVILRAEGTGLTAPILNDQAMYATINGATGSSSFVQNGNTWTVVSNINDNSTTTFNDALGGAGPYTYAIVMRDMAFNYSTATTVNFLAPPCTAPVAAGASVVTPSAIQCGTIARTLSLTGNGAGSAITYQWQSSSTLGGVYTNVGSSSNFGYLVINPTTTAFYRCTVTCSGNTTISTPVEVLVNPALPAGAYTINSTLPASVTNYQSFSQAVSAMNCGIAGPITFNVAPGTGPYVEQITIPQILGASNTNRVTFNGNGNTLSFVNTTTTARTLVTLNGADFITIDSLIIDASAVASAGFAWGISLTGQADSNIIRKCTVNISNFSSTTTSNLMGIVINGSLTATAVSGNNANGNQFLNNTIIGGANGFYLYGNSANSAQNVDNIIRGNTIVDFYGNGVLCTYMTSTTIGNNDIKRNNRTNSTTAYGITLTTGTIKTLVEKNRIHNLFDAFITSTNTSAGINLSTDATLGSENKIYNNAIYGMNGNGIQYGILNSGSDYVNIYHNTIVLDDAAATGTGYGIYQSTVAIGIVIKNNLVYVTKGGTAIKRCLHFNTLTSTIVSDKNVLYLNAPSGVDNKIGQWGTSSYTTLTDWKTANTNAYDQGSLVVDPNFVDVSLENFTPQEPIINGFGENLGIVTDILENVRTTSPDPGAYEFSLPPCTNPTEAGIAISSAINICANVNFTLGLSGNSVGSGINYQWQRTTDSTNRNSWVNIGVSQSTALFLTSQTDTFYYRCITSCGAGNPDTANMVKVITNPLPSGNFTINKTLSTGGSNFASFAEAISFISCGVGGPVTLTVSQGSGPYTEQITIPQISGTSSTSRVTIKGNLETLQFTNTTTSDRHIIRLDGSDFITIDSLVVDASSVTSGFAWGIVLINTADNNIIKNCTVNIGNLSGTSTTNFMGVVINGSSSATATSGNNGNDNQFLNNTVIGGASGFYLYGNSTNAAQNTNNVVQENTIDEFYGNGIFAQYISNATMAKNDIKRLTRTTATITYPINLNTGCSNILVEKNKIHNIFDAMPTSTALFGGIFIASDATLGNENKIYNNSIYAISGNGTQHGIFNSGGDFANIYHNSISLNDGSATTGPAYGITQTTLATSVNIKNNIVSVSRGGTGIKRCLNFTTNTSSIVSNNNVLFMNAAAGIDNKIGAWGTTSFALLDDWRLAKTPRFDSLSLSLDPAFIDPNNGNLQFTAISIDGIGENVGVTRDINDSTRGITPDPGCFEINYLVAGIDMKAETLVSPAIAPNSCYTASETVTVLIKNNSTTTINFVTNPATVTTQVIGATTQTLTRVVNTGTLASNATLAVPMTATLNMSANGAYSLLGSVAVVGDVNAANNAFSEAAIREKITINAGSVLASPNEVCAVTTTQPRLTATGLLGYSSLQWQQSTTPSTGFTNIATATSNSYTITAPITQTMYYRLQASCDVAQANSGEDTIMYVNPLITSTTPRFTCGTGSVKLDATATAGSTVSWYAAATGGIPLSVGERFNTPSIATNTTYYAAASTSIAGASPLLITEFDLGGNDRLEIQNISNTPINVAGWKVIASNSYTDINSVNANTQTLTGTLAPNEILSWTDATAGPNYWGSNLLWNPGAPSSFAGWAMILDNNNVIIDVVFLNWGSTNIQGMAITVGGTPITIGSKWSGAGVDISVVSAAQSVSRKGNTHNRNLTDFEIVDLTFGATNLNLSLPLSGFGCESPRVPVLATVDNSPGCTPLPITLLSFTGVKMGNVNKLDWITSSEVNSKGFYVERSIDGNKFSSIGYIASKSDNGTSTQNIAYSLIDEKPLIGNNYYRIKQVDKDGKVNYTNIIVLKSTNIKQVEINGIYPNPASNVLNISMVSPVAEKMSFLITDLQGKLLFQQNEMLQSGTNNYAININQLSAGNYLIKASCSKGCETKTFKFVKL